jgi:uncharacterized protein YjiS (DUF1127 family)
MPRIKWLYPSKEPGEPRLKIISPSFDPALWEALKEFATKRQTRRKLSAATVIKTFLLTDIPIPRDEIQKLYRKHGGRLPSDSPKVP